jgi:uncharacterized protein YraI
MFKRELRLLILMIGFGLLSLVSTAQTGVRIVIVNEFANVRTVPAIGASVLGTVSAGYEFTTVTARSGDGEWVRVDWLGTEGWVNLVPSVVLSGDVNALIVADPRSLPYAGIDGTPRAGTSGQTTGPMTGVATNGVRLRSGPSQGYPTISNIFANQQVIVTGRTASNQWYQVIHEGFIGWAFATFIQLNSPGDINSLLPIDGIAAEGQVTTGTSADDYITLLRLMLARLDLAQVSLDEIRAAWTDAALNGRASCKPYPPTPSNISIAIPLLSAYFDRLDPLQRLFNDAMTNTRLAINLFIEVCNQPGGANPVGSATVQGALDTINLADSQYVRIRTRLLELLPPDRIPGTDECVLSYQGSVEILPLITAGTIYADSHTPGNQITGYCFDALFGESYRFETLQLPGSNLVSFISVSPLNSPTDFIGVAAGTAGVDSTALGPVPIPENGRYLVIVSNLNSATTEPANGEFAFMLSNLTNSSATPTLVYDETTGTVSATSSVTSVDGGGTTTTTTTTDGTCPDPSFTCDSLFTCEEAFACYNNVPNFSLDGNGDGLPCNCTTSDANTVPSSEG